MPSRLNPDKVDYIIVHDTGGSADMSSGDIDRLHKSNVDSNGKHWSGIGYHWVVRKDGDLETGRSEGLQGAHVAPNKNSRVTIPHLNARSVAVVASGDSPVADMPGPQRDRLIDTVARLCIKYGVSSDHVKGHGEVELWRKGSGPETGNSDFKEGQMDRIRPLVKARMEAITREEGAHPAPLKPGPWAGRTQGADRPAAAPAPPAAQPRASPAPAARPTSPAAAAGPLVTGRFADPLPQGPHPITNRFGNATRGMNHSHRGLDFGVPVGARVNAMDGGTVVRTGTDRMAGNYVVIQHGDTGYTSIYQHLSKVDVKLNQTVHKDQQIGASGRTGVKSDGTRVNPHLHVAITKGATWSPSHWENNPDVYRDPARLIGAGPYATPEGQRRVGAAPAQAQPRNMLKVGMTGDDVRHLQYQMKGLGYGSRVGTIDGIFDTGLAAVVKQFQTDRGLPVKYQTGNAGPITRAEIAAAVKQNDRDGRAPAPARSTQPTAPKAAGTPVLPAPSGDGSRSALPIAPRVASPGTTAPGTTAPGTTAPGTTAPGTTAPGTTAPGTTAPGTTAPGTRPATDPVFTAASAAFLKESDAAISNILDRHVDDVPGALAALVRDTRGPGSGTLGATTVEDVQRSFAQFTAGDAAARPLSATEAGMVAQVIDERARIVGEGVLPSPPMSGDGAGTALPAVTPARPAVDTAPSL